MLPALEYVEAARISLDAEEVFCVWDVETTLDCCVLALDCATFTMFFLQRNVFKMTLL